jgi:hypothetical protein
MQSSPNYSTAIVSIPYSIASMTGYTTAKFTFLDSKTRLLILSGSSGTLNPSLYNENSREITASYPNGISISLRLNYIYNDSEPYIKYNGTIYYNYFKCPFDDTKNYSSGTECSDNCFRSVLADGSQQRYVNSASECRSISFICSNDNSYFTSQSNCIESCTRFRCSGNDIDYPNLDFCEKGCLDNVGPTFTPCSASGEEKKFSVSLIESSSSTGLISVLELLDSESDVRSRLSQSLYEHEFIILNQCVSRYFNPSLKFDEPGTNAHFEFAPIDYYIFKVGASRSEIPSDQELIGLPKQPAVYIGQVARSLEEQYMAQLEEMDEETNEIPELSSMGKSLQENPASKVPKLPMFWSKEFSQEWKDDSTVMLGKTFLNVLPNTPYIYYYQCPEGKTTIPPEDCGFLNPFGGVAYTVSGQRCFQYFCDDSASMEVGPQQYTGCGLVNDGFVQ